MTPSTTNTAARELPPSCGPADTLSNETLVEVVVQSAARNAMYDNKVQHDRLQECKAELLRRLATLTQQQGGEQEAHIETLRAMREPGGCVDDDAWVSAVDAAIAALAPAP